MLRLVRMAEDGSVQTLELQSCVNTVGRNAANLHCLSDASVSSFHCEIHLEAGRATVKDLGSTNGTFVDDQRIEQAVLRPGQRLRLGSVEFVCESAAEPPAQAQAPSETPWPEAAPAVACRYHPQVAAEWICRTCLQKFCGHCLRIRQVGARTWRLCPICQGECKPLVEVAATETQLLSKAAPSFFQRLPGAFGYPFAKGGLALLIGGTILFWLLSLAQSVVYFAGILGLVAGVILLVFSFGYLFAYMQRIIVSSAQGEDNLPGWPEFSDWGSDIIRPCLMLGFTLVICFAPPLVYLIWTAKAGEEVDGMILYPLAAFSIIYFPMALAAVALADDFLALQPIVVLPAIVRIPGQYLLAVVVFFLLVGVRHFSEDLLRSILPVPGLPGLLTSFLALYLLTVEMRVLGLLYFTNREKFGWFRS